MKNTLFVAATIFLVVTILAFAPNSSTNPNKLIYNLDAKTEREREIVTQTYKASTRMGKVYANTLFVIYGLFAVSVISDSILSRADKKRHNQSLESDGNDSDAVR